MGVILRGYQAAIVDDIRASYSSGYRAPLVQLPTGGGKTTIFCHVAAEAVKKQNPVFLICHRVELVKQISKTLSAVGVSHAIIAPKKTVNQCEAVAGALIDPSALVVVASVQTIVNRFDSIDITPKIIIIDEAHHLTKNSTWGRVVLRYPAARLLLVSATPARLDGQGLGLKNDGFADTIIEGPSMRWLIDNGFLSDFKIFAPPLSETIDLSTVGKIGGDYQKNKLSAVMDKPKITGDVVGHYLHLSAGRRAVAFCCSVKHAGNVSDGFNAAGVPAAVLDGGMDADTRAETIAQFERGEIMVLCTVDIVSEGFDLPAIETVILLRPTASLALYLQQVGRALRLFAGKEFALIIDHVNAYFRHGWPDDARTWTLDGVKKATKSDQDAVLIKTCLSCFAIYRPSPVCPNCGHVNPVSSRQIKQVGGVLVELTREEKAANKAEREKLAAIESARKRQEEKKARTYDDFLLLAVQRGYNYPEQWAEKRASFKKYKKNH